MAIIVADLFQIEQNIRWFIVQATESGASVSAVTKFCTSEPDIVASLYSCGIQSIADSNMKNFSQSFPSELRKDLIKTRMSDIRSLPFLPQEHTPDRVFVSDRELLHAIREISPECRPEIVLIAELGDFKEGMYPDDIRTCLREFRDLPIIGVSANFACLSGFLPDIMSIKLLHSLAIEIVEFKQLPTAFVSIGGTVVWQLLLSGALKGLVSELRIGEGIFFGYDSSGNTTIPGLSSSCFTLKGEIVEISIKEITAGKNSGHTALGTEVASRPTGKRTCAVLDFGILAGGEANLKPHDPGLIVVGQTFDFTVADITNSRLKYKSGDFIPFGVQYTGASQAYINPYIERSVIHKAYKDT